MLKETVAASGIEDGTAAVVAAQESEQDAVMSVFLRDVEIVAAGPIFLPAVERIGWLVTALDREMADGAPGKPE